MRAAVIAEFRKLFQTRLWWILLLAMAAYVALGSAMLSFSFTAVGSGAQLPPVEAARSAFSTVNGMGYAFPLILGSLVATTEFRHQTVSRSLLVEPRRELFLLGKVVAVLPFGVLFGLAATAGALLGGVPILLWQGEGAQLGNSDVLSGLAMGVVSTMLWMALGVVFGMLVRNQVVAIVGLLIFTQFVEPILRLVAGSVDALNGVGPYLPGGAADSMIGASMFGDAINAQLLPVWAGALVMLAYIVAFALLARSTTLRADIG